MSGAKRKYQSQHKGRDKAGDPFCDEHQYQGVLIVSNTGAPE